MIARKTGKGARSDPLERWLRAAEKQVTDQWFDSPRRSDYLDVCLELRRLAAESGRRQFAESPVLWCLYGPDPRTFGKKGGGKTA